MMSDSITRLFYCHTCKSSSYIDVSYLFCPKCNSDFLEEGKMLEPGFEELAKKESSASSESEDELPQRTNALPRLEIPIPPIFRLIGFDNFMNSRNFFSNFRLPRHEQESFDDSSDESFSFDFGGFMRNTPRRMPATTDRINMIEIIAIDETLVETDCKICGELFKLDEQAQVLECSHVFHKDCLVPWLKIKDTCPLCRRSIE